ncbi:MAG: lysostaphin resistance A-like protein [Terriglobia bacterium]
MSTATTPAPGSERAAAPQRSLGGFGELFIFFGLAIILFVLVQVVVVSALVYTVNQQNPHLTWSEISREVSERTQFNAFFSVPVQTIYYALLVLLLYALLRARRLPFWSSLALRRLSAAHLGAAVAIGALLALLIQFASVIVPPPETLPIERLFSSRAAAWLIIAASLLIAPLVEELIFRGYIYTLFEHRLGVAAAVLASGLLFGSIHFPQLYPGYFQMLLLCVVGIVFSLTRAQTGTLLASIVAHFAYNATLNLLFLASPQFRELAFGF